MMLIRLTTSKQPTRDLYLQGDPESHTKAKATVGPATSLARHRTWKYHLHGTGAASMNKKYRGFHEGLVPHGSKE